MRISKSIEIFITCIIALFTIYKGSEWKSLDYLGKIFVIIGMLLAILIAINLIIQLKKEALLEKVNRKFGDIKDIDDATYPKIAVGNINNGVVIYSQNEKCFLNVDTGAPLLKLYVIKNKLSIYIVVRNFYGEPIGVIEDNTWTIYNNDFEYNNDDTAFELVTKGERGVYFQIVFRNGVAHISGCLLNNKGNGLVFFNDNNRSLMLVIKKDESKTIKIEKEMERITNLNIPRIFKYPREKHIGERL